MHNSLYVGLMSGTSIDAIDTAIVQCKDKQTTIIACREHTIPTATRQRIASLSSSGPDEIEQLGRLDREVGLLFAEATLALLSQAAIPTEDIEAIGSHGQTIRHRPPSANHPENQSFTLQIGDPNSIAEQTGIVTVADFRRRDIAAGGEGAPLAPAFHAAAFAKANVTRAIVNIGGIANASILNGQKSLIGFDTGPGNTLMDHWIERHTGERYDCDGQWAAQATANPPLLEKLLEHPYFKISGPRSTGKEAFNLAWIEKLCPELSSLSPDEVQASLSEFTAITIAKGLQSSQLDIAEVYVCGGGAHNSDLMSRLSRHICVPILETTAALGIDPDWVEAAAFAWMAKQTLKGLPGNAPSVTGASGHRVLGGIYPA